MSKRICIHTNIRNILILIHTLSTLIYTIYTHLQNKLPNNTPIERISEGVESNAFRSEFFKWDVVVNIPKGIAASKNDQPVCALHVMLRLYYVYAVPVYVILFIKIY